MDEIENLLLPLTRQHKVALIWFLENADGIRPWPKPLDDGTLLATRAKGIYKPKWSQYALSVREVPGAYPDREPKVSASGSWYYDYYQESFDPDARDQEYANRGLMACRDARVPVGVMRQVSGKPRVRYHILGLALVSGWDKGYFRLEGLTRLAPGRS